MPPAGRRHHGRSISFSDDITGDVTDSQQVVSAPQRHVDVTMTCGVQPRVLASFCCLITGGVVIYVLKPIETQF